MCFLVMLLNIHYLCFQWNALKSNLKWMCGILLYGGVRPWAGVSQLSLHQISYDKSRAAKHTNTHTHARVGQIKNWSSRLEVYFIFLLASVLSSPSHFFFGVKNRWKWGWIRLVHRNKRNKATQTSVWEIQEVPDEMMHTMWHQADIKKQSWVMHQMFSIYSPWFCLQY